jgi:glyoxylase-like metal-dependent hydrolase (beta-lactamase superfamily II)
MLISDRKAMLNLKAFVFNPFQENTYLLSDETGACAILDPGCFTSSEEQILKTYVQQQGLQVKLLLNTHGHIDHMLGNAFVKQTYEVPFETGHGVVEELEAALDFGKIVGIKPMPSPEPDRLLSAGDTVQFGEIELEVLFTPGHSAGHISFFHRDSQSLFSGDVLFRGGIGRYDLPGGSYDVLMQTIAEQLLPLGDEVKVYSGHGSPTQIGQERRSNGYLQEYFSK